MATKERIKDLSLASLSRRTKYDDDDEDEGETVQSRITSSPKRQTTTNNDLKENKVSGQRVSKPLSKTPMEASASNKKRKQDTSTSEADSSDDDDRLFRLSKPLSEPSERVPPNKGSVLKHLLEAPPPPPPPVESMSFEVAVLKSKWLAEHAKREEEKAKTPGKRRWNESKASLRESLQKTLMDELEKGERALLIKEFRNTLMRDHSAELHKIAREQIIQELREQLKPELPEIEADIRIQVSNAIRDRIIHEESALIEQNERHKLQDAIYERVLSEIEPLVAEKRRALGKEIRVRLRKQPNEMNGIVRLARQQVLEATKIKVAKAERESMIQEARTALMDESLLNEIISRLPPTVAEQARQALFPLHANNSGPSLDMDKSLFFSGNESSSDDSSEHSELSNDT